MKKLFAFLLIIITCCQRTESTDKFEDMARKKPESVVLLYRSTDDSFQKKFFLRIEKDTAVIFGWFETMEKDIVYYRSEGIIKNDINEMMEIEFQKFSFTKTEININNLEPFKTDIDLLSSSNLYFLYTFLRFINGKRSGDIIEFMAVKHAYGSRADNFRFKRIR